VELRFGISAHLFVLAFLPGPRENHLGLIQQAIDEVN
jgi:hypothetical protein